MISKNRMKKTTHITILSWAIFLPSIGFAAKEQIEQTQSFSLVWQAPWSIPKLVLCAVICFLLYSIMTTNFFSWLLDKRKLADSCMMPQKAFKLTILLTLIIWMITVGFIFGLTPNQELRISANVLPGGKTLYLVNYIDNYLFFFCVACLLIVAIAYIMMPGGDHRSNEN